ncbi:MAG: class I SAM-dependent methyltransferase [Proteobacteria bacterium]|nr:class I SAM-dependent methyltransferase [Pseudomonadota bacterium]
MDWRVKGAIQKVLGYVPGGYQLHYLLQQRGGGLSNFNAECDMKVDDWAIMMGNLRTAKVAFADAEMMEMGTGWYPTFPLCLFLVGTRRIHTVDLTRHLKPEKTLALAERLATHVPRIAAAGGVDEATVRTRLARVHDKLAAGASIEAATDGAIEYHAPSDATDTRLIGGSLDVVFSNSVLEHVPGPVIAACFTEAMRILKPGGLVFHSVNCGDHYAYTDPRIDQLHYLQYSEAAWAKWNNSFLYQNRLRAVDFTQMARAAGFVIESDTSRALPERVAAVEQMTVDPCFARYSPVQLAITSIDFVGRKLHKP